MKNKREFKTVAKNRAERAVCYNQLEEVHTRISKIQAEMLLSAIEHRTEKKKENDPSCSIQL